MRTPLPPIVALLLALCAMSARASAPPPSVLYYGVYLKESKLGSLTLSRSVVQRENRAAVKTVTRMQMDLVVMGTPSKIVAESTSWNDARSGAPLALEVRNETSGRVTEISAVYTARSVRFVARIQGVPRRGELSLRDGERFLVDMTNTQNTAPKVGQVARGKVFDSDGLRLLDSEIVVAGRETITVEGRATPALRLLDKNPTSPGTIYLSDSGEMLRAEMALGMQVRRESRARALAVGDGTTPDLTTLVATVPTGVALEEPRTLRRAVYALGGVTRPLPPDDSVQQTVLVPDAPAREKNEKTLRVTVTALSLPETDAIIPLFASPTAAPERLRPFLKSTAYVPADSAEFRALARAVIGRETSAPHVARKLADWVHANIKVDASIATLRSASDINRDRRGVCRDYTTFFATLARAAGLPTKQCVGLAYVDGRFLYHAWPEVWTGIGADGKDRWVALEPTWGAPFADATHIKLAEGELTDLFLVSADMGRYQIVVEEIE
jgi:hypothetical protein